MEHEGAGADAHEIWAGVGLGGGFLSGLGVGGGGGLLGGLGLGFGWALGWLASGFAVRGLLFHNLGILHLVDLHGR